MIRLKFFLIDFLVGLLSRFKPILPKKLLAWVEWQETCIWYFDGGWQKYKDENYETLEVEQLHDT